MKMERRESKIGCLKIFLTFFKGKDFNALNFYELSMKKLNAVFEPVIVALFLFAGASGALGENIVKGVDPDIIKYRKMWEQYTKGNNLALGKPFVFSLKPDYSLTAKGDAATTALTDGKISSLKDDKIWFDSSAVGWYWGGAENGMNCLLDLGETKPVGSVVIRALAGKVLPSLVAPAEFKIFVSRDGKDFYESASMVKLMQGEKDLSNFKTHYYLDEMGKAYVYPFKLEVNADARYVGVYIKGATGQVFLDEISVMEGNAKNAAVFNEAYQGTKQKFITSGILIEPRLKELAISTNINTPNALQVSDMRNKDSAAKPVSIVVEAPEGVNIIAPEAQKIPIIFNGNKYAQWKLPLKKSPVNSQTVMIFFTADKSVNMNLPAYIYAECEGIEPEKTQVPIRLLEIPLVKPQMKRLHISLTWMGEKAPNEYPDFFAAWKYMGFNAVGCFPRNWVSSESSSKDQTEALAFIDSARKEGFKIIMNESPFHVMAKGHKEGSEIFSQLKSGLKNKNLCPAYKGTFYEKEMARVAQGVALTTPDYVFWDIECWYPGSKEAAACTRCLEEQKKSGKSMDEFLKDCGTERVKDLKDAVRKGIGGGKMPVIGFYDTRPTAPNYDGISDFNRFYPASVDISANSFYVQGNALKVHDEMRENYKTLKCNKCIPWLSTGTYGKFDPYKLEQMVLEALLNGICGITYFTYWDFDSPRDFYYHSKALSEIAPYENIIMDGTVMTDLEGSNKNLTYSAVKKGNEMLLLVGNYKRTADGEAEIKLPFKEIVEIRDLRDNGNQIKSGNNLKINVPKSQIILYYIEGIE